MSKIWRPQAIEIYQYWVQSILDEASDNLTVWESNFVEDIKMRLERGWNLSEAQANHLEKIYAAKTS